jgi:hypothetical protein
VAAQLEASSDGRETNERTTRSGVAILHACQALSHIIFHHARGPSLRLDLPALRPRPCSLYKKQGSATFHLLPSGCEVQP